MPFCAVLSLDYSHREISAVCLGSFGGGGQRFWVRSLFAAAVSGRPPLKFSAINRAASAMSLLPAPARTLASGGYERFFFC